MTQEPVRLLLDPAIGPALRRDLGAVARVDAEYDVAGGLARFEGNLAAGTGVAKSAGLSGGTIAGAALLLVGGLTAAFLLWPGSTPTPEPVSPGAGVVAVAPIHNPAPTPAVAEPPRPARAIAEEEPTPSAALAHTSPAPELAITKPLKRPTRPKASEAEPVDAAPAATPDDALREARNLHAARSNLGRNPARALALAEAGAGEFKGGTFAQEWEGVAILALFELGRPEARARGEAFLQTYPSGTYAQRVRQALAD